MAIVIRTPGSQIATLIEEEDLPQTIAGAPPGSYQIGRATIDWMDGIVTISEPTNSPSIAVPISATPPDIRLGTPFLLDLGVIGGAGPLEEVLVVADLDGALPEGLIEAVAARQLSITARRLGPVIITYNVSNADGAAPTQAISVEVAAGRPSAWPSEAWSVAPGEDPETLVISLTDLPAPNGAPITQIAYRLGEDDDQIHTVAIGPVPGDYAITAGVRGGVEQDVQIAAVNAVGRAAGWGALRSSTSLAGEVPGDVSVPLLYPAVPAVDVGAAGGSLQFPEYNWESSQASAPIRRGALIQPAVSGGYAPPGTAPGAIIVIARLPIAKRMYAASNYFGLFGNGLGSANNIGMAFYPSNYNTGTMRQVLRYYQRGNTGSTADLNSAPVTEERFMAVAWTDGANTWQLDWYSLATGQRYAGEAKVTAGTVLRPYANTFGIGQFTTTATFDTETSNTAGLWPGEIEAIYAYTGTALTPADFSQIALGARIQDKVPAANIAYAFEPRSVATIGKPAWAPGSYGAPAPRGGAFGGTGSVLYPGSHLRRQSPAQYLTMDPLQHGWVYGLTATGTSCDVPFAGDAAGYTGPVEVRVFEGESGRVVCDWTAVGVIAGGRWAGKVRLPRAEGWWVAQARLAADHAVVWDRRDAFAVGYKFLLVGQSTTEIPLNAGAVGLPLTHPFSASFLELQEVGSRPAAGARWWNMGRIGQRHTQDGKVAFLNQFRAFDPKTPIMLVDEAVNGTAMMTLINGGIDSDTNRQWLDLTEKLDRFGNDITAVLFNWAANESLGYSTIYNGIQAFFEGTGPAAPSTGYCLANVLRPGWTAANMPRSRAQSSTPYGDTLIERMRFFEERGYAQSDVAVDNRLKPPQVGHQDGNSLLGCARFMQRFAVGALRALALDSSTNPYFDNPRSSGNKITVDCVATNGGTIYSPAPTLLRSWYVKEPTDADYVNVASGRFTAALVAGKVELTRTSGTWPAGTLVWRMSAGEQRNAGTEAEEDAILAGGIYETWAPDPLGYGKLLCGTMGADGRWDLEFREEALPFEAAATAEIDVVSFDGGISAHVSGAAEVVYTADPQPQVVLRVAPGGSVTVQSRTPETAITASGQTIHGSTLNLTTVLDDGAGFDRRLTDTSGSNGYFSAGKVVTFPLQLQAGDILTLARSRETPSLASQGRRKGLIQEYLTLTVTDQPIPAGEIYAPQVPRAQVGPVVFDDALDVDAILNALPSYPNAGVSYKPSSATIDEYLLRAEKFAPTFRQNFHSAESTGYELFTPHASGYIGGSNYGVDLTQAAMVVMGVLWTDAGTPDQRRRAIRAMYSRGKQWNDAPTGPDGAHYTFHLPYVAFYRWCQGLPQYALGDPRGGNLTCQFYRETAASIAEMTTPHSDPLKSWPARLRTVTAVEGAAVTVTRSSALGDSRKPGCSGLYLGTADKAKQALILKPVDGDNTTSSLLLTLDTADHGFAVGDQVWMYPSWPIAVGDPQWAIRHSQPAYSSSRNASPTAGYRGVWRGIGDFLLMARALGFSHPSWSPAEDYIERAQTRTWPSASQIYYAGFAKASVNGSWSERLWEAHWPTLKALPQPYA